MRNVSRVVHDESPAVAAIVSALKFAPRRAGLPAHGRQVLLLGKARDCGQYEANGECAVLREAEVKHRPG
jgi:hypothetical protein